MEYGLLHRNWHCGILPNAHSLMAVTINRLSYVTPDVLLDVLGSDRGGLSIRRPTPGKWYTRRALREVGRDELRT